MQVRAPSKSAARKTADLTNEQAIIKHNNRYFHMLRELAHPGESGHMAWSIGGMWSEEWIRVAEADPVFRQGVQEILSEAGAGSTITVWRWVHGDSVSGDWLTGSVLSNFAPAIIESGRPGEIEVWEAPTSTVVAFGSIMEGEVFLRRSGARRVDTLNKTASKTATFAPSQIASWGSTKPWNLTREQAEAQSVPGFWHRSTRGSESASWDGRYIRTTDEFYGLPEDARRAIAYHEAGHAMVDAAGGLPGLNEVYDFVDLMALPGAQSMSYNAEEVIAEAYSVLWTEPEWFEQAGAHEIRRIAIEMIKRSRFPMPPGITTTAATAPGQAAANRIRDRMPEIDGFYVADRQGRWIVNAIDVKPEYRRQGVGTKAMLAIIEEAKAAGVELMLTPAPFADEPVSKTRLEKWYRSLGFAPASRYDKMVWSETMTYTGTGVVMKTSKTAALDNEARISVAEHALERHGLDGRVWYLPELTRYDDPVYNAGMQSIRRFVSSVAGRPVDVQIASDYVLKHDLAGAQAMVTPSGTMVVRPGTVNDLTLLHECAHIINRSTHGEGHDDAFIAIAADLYGQHISPQAKERFLNLVYLDGRTASSGLSGQVDALVAEWNLPATARDGDCLDVSRRLAQALPGAVEASVYGWVADGILGFLHRAVVVDGVVVDATATQFADLPMPWVVDVDNYEHELAEATGVSSVEVKVDRTAKTAAMREHIGEWDRTGPEMVWVGPYDELVREALYSWKGSLSSMHIHMTDEIAKAPQPGSGSGKKMRAAAKALLAELSRAGTNPVRLYRGGAQAASWIEGWSEKRTVAEAFAKRYGGQVFVLEPGRAKAIRIADYISSGLDDIESEWLVVQPGVRTASRLDDAIEELAQTIMDARHTPVPGKDYNLWGERPEIVEPDWNAILSRHTYMYRGLGLRVTSEEYDAVMGDDLDSVDKANLIVSKLRGDVGMYWTVHRGEAAGFAGMNADRGDLRVILEAVTPSASAIDTDRDGHRYTGWSDTHGEQEITVRRGTQLRISTVEWAPGGPRPMLRSDDGGGWQMGSPGHGVTRSAAHSPVHDEFLFSL